MSDEKSPPNPLSDWLRLQSDFQARLADETLRYLRRLQGAVAPATPVPRWCPRMGRISRQMPRRAVHLKLRWK